MTPAVLAAQAAVRTTSGESIATGMWTVVGILLTTIGLVTVAIVKQWGPWKRVASDDRAADFSRLREEIATQNGRIEKLEGLVEKANTAATRASEHAVRSDAKLQTALTACELLLALVEREMPQATEIGLVKRLLAQAAADDLGVGDGMRKLAMMKGVGE